MKNGPVLSNFHSVFTSYIHITYMHNLAQYCTLSTYSYTHNYKLQIYYIFDVINKLLVMILIT